VNQTASVWQPEREIEILAGTPLGGGLDRTARMLLAALDEQHLLPRGARVVNIPGDGARKVWQTVDAHAGDPHVLCISSPNLTTDFLTGVASFNHASYSPLAILYNEYLAFVTRRDSSYRSAGDLVRRLREAAASIKVALSTAAGNPNHIALAEVTQHAGGDLRAPEIRVFDSALDAVADVVAGNADIAVITAASAVQAIQAGAVRALAVTAPARLNGAYSHTPAWQELDVPCTLGAWRGVHGARGLNPDHITFWAHALTRATEARAWQDALAQQALTPMCVTGAALPDALAREQTHMATMLARLSIKT